jgi:hypothetical protein
MLTLVLAVILSAAALIYLNFSQLRTFERDKVVENSLHRDFQELLAITEKKMNKKAITMTEDVRNLFPSPDTDAQEKEKQLDLILAKNPWLSQVLLCEEKGFLFRSQPYLMGDKQRRKEQEQMAEKYRGWYNVEGKMLVQMLHQKDRPINFYTGSTKRADGDAYITTAMFTVPRLARDRAVLGGASFDVDYLKLSFRE